MDLECRATLSSLSSRVDAHCQVDWEQFEFAMQELRRRLKTGAFRAQRAERNLKLAQQSRQNCGGTKIQ
eukprot:5685933-Amphidinium_carterae.1